MKLLVTRPLPGGEATAERLRALGHQVTLTPLMMTQPRAWAPPAAAPAAIMVTSAFAARLAGPAAHAFHALPCFAVGNATAAAARNAGFTDVRDGGGTAQALLDTVAATGATNILHLAGEDRTAVVVPASLTATTITVYSARLMPLTVEPINIDWVLLYSPRTAAHFAAECHRLGVPRAKIAIAAISAAAIGAAGPGWARAIAAETPDEDALLAAIGIAWHKGPDKLQG